MEQTETSREQGASQVGARSSAAPAWRVDRIHPDSACVYVHDDAGEIAVCYRRTGGIDEASARARLIAAAPDMLAALETALEETFHVAVNGHLDTDAHVTREQAIKIYEAARVAVLKARAT